MTEYRVIIPDESYSIIKFRQDELPGVGVVNTALRDFGPRVVFGWHLSLMIQLDDLIEDGMPSLAERKVVDQFEETLDAAIKGSDTDKPNALFLARITWNATREVVWRIFDPELANQFLQSIVNGDATVRPRAITYRIDHDPEWQLAEWFLVDHEAEG